MHRRIPPGTVAVWIPVDVMETVFGVGWAAFGLYWLVAAFFVKQGHVRWSRELEIRAVVIVGVIVLIRLGAARGHSVDTDAWRAGLGLVLFALGLGFAIWARVNIGRNWGTPMTQKVDPELVTSGPYHLVRHPIYSGILVAGVGTALALNWQWLIVVALAGIYFVYSATVEERYMNEQFPDTYPDYKHATKMLLPFIFLTSLGRLLTQKNTLGSPTGHHQRHRGLPIAASGLRCQEVGSTPCVLPPRSVVKRNAWGSRCAGDCGALTRSCYRFPRPNMRPSLSAIDLAGLISTRLDPPGGGRFAACSAVSVVRT